ncbi:AEC family transporter [Ancylobacter sp. 6x-1]|uniref:AEC family transporter n=1 Tax=Ancylobacter crimeensis TaxID=2579147 RepID=A0ABT0DCC1_9HYPH|nr:AEC family transporter [Ancylobacter crimeensis]MCK0197605.1 AEC family transporter [Ancylobacter crimeensis]
MGNVLSALLPVFLIIGLGAVLRRSLLPDDVHWAALERLSYYILFPALLVISIARADLGGVAVLGVCIALLGAIALMGTALIFTRDWWCRRLRLSGPSYTSLFQGALRWNTYVGLAVSGSLAGPAGLAVAAVALTVMIPTLNTMSVMVLARHGRNAAPGWTNMMAQVLRNPFIWSCAAGAIINAIHLPIPPVLMTFGDILGRSSLALGLLVVGAGLDLRSLRHPHRATFVSCALKLVVLPILAVALGLACGLSGVDLTVVAVAASVPSAPNGYVLARQMGGDAPLLAEMLTLQTLSAAITMPMVIAAVERIQSYL